MSSRSGAASLSIADHRIRREALDAALRNFSGASADVVVAGAKAFEAYLRDAYSE